ncbi:MAG: sensor histidine kinase [Nocardioidaceae bacterium]
MLSWLSSFRRQVGQFFCLDDLWERVPARQAVRNDAALAVVLFAFSALGLELVRSLAVLTRVDEPIWAQYLPLLGVTLPIVGRRRWPLTAMLIATLSFFVFGQLMPTVIMQFPVQVLYFFVLFSGVAWGRERRTVTMAVAGVLVVMFGWLTWQYAVGSSAQSTLDAVNDRPPAHGIFGEVTASVFYTLLINIVYFGAAIIGGQVSWRGARQRRRLADQAATLATQSDELRDHAVVEERMRIARELHDSVAQHVSVMGVQAAAARRVLDKDQDSAAKALESVESSARRAVGEMRSLLGALRSSEPGADISDGRAPQPGLTDLADLVAQSDVAPMQVSFAVVEDPSKASGTVPDQVALALYRTTQEALANVSRHSTATNTSVVLRVQAPPTGSRYAEVEILDDGRPREQTSGTGLGVLGIRERVTSLRGTTEIGPRATGGYRVRVRLPLPEAHA